MAGIRKIIHVDMDAFYASVEQRDRPELRGRPVIVGGDPHGRGVVAACSYEARRFGIHSAMPGRTALRRCPQAVFVRPRFDAYKAVSVEIRGIFREYTDLVEPLSLDEAFLDVTENKPGIPYATRVAREIRTRIRQSTGLTASAGVSFNKFLAKVASDENKPDGLTVIPPELADDFIARLPIRKFFGVGRVTEQKMAALGIHTGADLRRLTRGDLIRLFGKAGAYFHDIASGTDPRPVEPHRERKSIGRECTLIEDIADRPRMLAVLSEIADELAADIARHNVCGVTLTLKVKYEDFQVVTRSLTTQNPFRSAADLTAPLPGLLNATQAGSRKVRLLGLGVSHFERPGRPGALIQLPLPLVMPGEVLPQCSISAFRSRPARGCGAGSGRDHEVGLRGSQQVR